MFVPSFGQESDDEMKEELFADFTDELGRTLSKVQVPAGKKEKDRFVGIFYFLLYGSDGGDTDKFNVCKIFSENEDALTNSGLWSPDQKTYWWGEPLLGYYNLTVDKYVFRKHASMLCDAGVDTIIIDFSNVCVNGEESIVYNLLRPALKKLCDTWLEIRNEGGVTPRITLLMTWSDNGAAAGFKHLEKDFYSKEQYSDLWFRWEGKPLVVGSGNLVDEKYHKDYTFRQAWPFYQSPDVPDAWPWMSVYPQNPGYTETNPNEIVAVSIAQNWHEGLDRKAYCFMSDTDSEGNFIAQGRSYTYGGENVLSGSPVSSEYDSIHGANFQQQWDRAIELDPDFVFVTGWNEWCAARFVGEDFPVIGKMCDQFCPEFSRDIEPTRSAGLGDSAYCQLRLNIKRYKGNNNMTVYKPSGSGTFTESGNDKADRNAKSAGSKIYKNKTGRNDFISCSAKDSGDSVIFYAGTAEDITSPDGTLWMNLYIGIRDANGNLTSEPNWEGYSFLVNGSVISDCRTTVQKSLGGYSWETVSDSISYRLEGSEIEITVPKPLLGITPGSPYSVIFKWADNIDVSDDVLNFYTDGDTVPNGRDYCVYNFGITEAEMNPQSDGSAGKSSKPGLLPLAIAMCGAAIAAVAALVLTFKKGRK